MFFFAWLTNYSEHFYILLLVLIDTLFWIQVLTLYTCILYQRLILLFWWLWTFERQCLDAVTFVIYDIVLCWALVTVARERNMQCTFELSTLSWHTVMSWSRTSLPSWNSPKYFNLNFVLVYAVIPRTVHFIDIWSWLVLRRGSSTIHILFEYIFSKVITPIIIK